jgi:hypothetical protein
MKPHTILGFPEEPEILALMQKDFKKLNKRVTKKLGSIIDRELVPTPPAGVTASDDRHISTLFMPNEKDSHKWLSRTGKVPFVEVVLWLGTSNTDMSAAAISELRQRPFDTDVMGKVQGSNEITPTQLLLGGNRPELTMDFTAASDDEVRLHGNWLTGALGELQNVADTLENFPETYALGSMSPYSEGLGLLVLQQTGIDPVNR